MGGVISEERAIRCTQYLDLVYSQSSNMYDLIPHAPWPTTDPLRPTTKPHVGGIFVSVQTQMMKKYTKKQTPSTTPVIQQSPPSKTAPSPISSPKLNAVQSIESSGGKNKGKNKLKKNENQ